MFLPLPKDPSNNPNNKTIENVVRKVKDQFWNLVPQIFSQSPKLLYVDDATNASPSPFSNDPALVQKSLPPSSQRRLDQDTLANLQSFPKRSNPSLLNSNLPPTNINSTPINQSAHELEAVYLDSKSESSTVSQDSTSSSKSSPSDQSPLLQSPTAILSQASAHNIQVGDDIIDKDPSHLRIILQNPNGISCENDMFEYQYCLHQMHSLCADVILLPETNLYWPIYSIQKSMSDHRKNLHRYSKQVSSCSSLSYKTPYQPGGTCSIMTGNSTGRFHSSQRDEKLGRWSVLHLNLPGSKILSIICCYQCCKHTIQSAGPKTAYSQQWSILHDSGIAHPNPRKQFIKDLDKLLSKLASPGHSIVLAGDFNETIGDKP